MTYYGGSEYAVAVFTGDKPGNEPLTRPKRIKNYSPYTSCIKGCKGSCHRTSLTYEVKFVFTKEVQE